MRIPSGPGHLLLFMEGPFFRPRPYSMETVGSRGSGFSSPQLGDAAPSPWGGSWRRSGLRPPQWGDAALLGHHYRTPWPSDAFALTMEGATWGPPFLPPPLSCPTTPKFQIIEKKVFGDRRWIDEVLDRLFAHTDFAVMLPLIHFPQFSILA